MNSCLAKRCSSAKAAWNAWWVFLRLLDALPTHHSGSCLCRIGSMGSKRGVDPVAHGVQVGGQPVTISSVAHRPLDTDATFHSGIIAEATRRREALVDSLLWEKGFRLFIEEGALVVASCQHRQRPLTGDPFRVFRGPRQSRSHRRDLQLAVRPIKCAGEREPRTWVILLSFAQNMGEFPPTLVFDPHRPTYALARAWKSRRFLARAGGASIGSPPPRKIATKNAQNTFHLSKPFP